MDLGKKFIEGLGRIGAGLAATIGKAVEDLFGALKAIRDNWNAVDVVAYRSRVVRLLVKRNARTTAKIVAELPDLAAAMIQAAEEQGIIVPDGENENGTE